ncbi:hypothetical protein MTO96_009847 [Rhipicephalus appendiculatus]
MCGTELYVRRRGEESTRQRRTNKTLNASGEQDKTEETEAALYQLTYVFCVTEEQPLTMDAAKFRRNRKRISAGNTVPTCNKQRTGCRDHSVFIAALLKYGM